MEALGRREEVLEARVYVPGERKEERREKEKEKVVGRADWGRERGRWGGSVGKRCPGMG